MAEITVGLGERSYPIIIKPGCLADVGARLAEMKIGARYAIVADSHVAELYGEMLQESLTQAGLVFSLFSFPRGEASKTLATMGALASELAEARFGRGDAIIALGGGVTGDLAGFLASSYMRGIPFVQIPTTLLAQVDSSVGGKTGVDIPEGKNLIGAFYQPKAVFIDTELLATLDRDEILGGMAEVIKYGVIWDSEFFTYLEEHRDAILGLERDALIHTITTCCAIKAAIVAQDEREGDVRKILNYGHTVGHAVEAESGFSIIHGLAVAIGMRKAADLAVLEGLLEPAERDRIIKILVDYEMPIIIPEEQSRENILSYLEVDKKVEAGRIIFVLPETIGRVVVTGDIHKHYLEAVLCS